MRREHAAREFARRFYDSKSWRSVRDSYQASRVLVDGGTCEMCKAVPGVDVDHIEELTPDNWRDPRVATSHKNLQLICKACHAAKTHGMADQMVRFDAEGRPIHLDVRRPEAPHRDEAIGPAEQRRLTSL